jgi:toxin ParE1/3/4
VTGKQVVPREEAHRDIQAIVDHYLAEGADEAALGFLEALQRAFDRISRHPALGSPHYALELRIAGLRCWPIRRFPYLVFYVDAGSAIEIWRVLHGRRDIPAWLATSS